MDILGFQAAVDLGPRSIISVYDLLSASFESRHLPDITSYIAVSDSLIVSAQSPEPILNFALQIFRNFFSNLDELTKPDTIPVLIRGGIAYDWLAIPYAPRFTDNFAIKDGAVNLVGKAYSDAFFLSEKAPLEGQGEGARLRVSERALSQIDVLKATSMVGADQRSYWEVDWCTEIFRDYPYSASRMINNVRRCIERFRNEPALLGPKQKARERKKKHWNTTLALLKAAAQEMNICDIASAGGSDNDDFL